MDVKERVLATVRSRLQVPEFVSELRVEAYKRPTTSEVAEAVRLPEHVVHGALVRLCHEDHLVVRGRLFLEDTWLARA